MGALLVEAEQAGAVEDDEEGAELVQRRRGDWVDDAERGERDEEGDEGESAEEILIDDAQRAVAQYEKTRQVAKVVAHEGDVGRLDGDVAAQRAHRYAEIARGEGGRVVHAITDHEDAAAGGFEATNLGEFFLGQAFGAEP